MLRKIEGELWDSKKRAGHSIHEISYRACFKPELVQFFMDEYYRRRRYGIRSVHGTRHDGDRGETQPSPCDRERCEPVMPDDYQAPSQPADG